MASSGVLKEFVVKLGFKLDQQQLKNFQEGMRGIAARSTELTKSFIALGEASALSITAVGTALTAASKQLEGLYFSSQRTGASAKELQTFSFAAEQIGVSAEQARAAVEGLAAARRTNPGLNGILGDPNNPNVGLGIDPRQTDNAKVLVELLGKLHAIPHFQGAQIASLFGIDEATLNQLENNAPELLKAMQLREKLFSSDGVDPDKFDKQGHQFLMQLRRLGASALDLSEIIATRLIPSGNAVIVWLQGAVGWLAKADQWTGGWSSKLIGLALTLKTFAASLGIIGRLTGISGIVKGIGLGRGAAVAGGEAAAGAVAGEGAAAGGGLLAAASSLLPVLIPLIVGAAAIAAVAWVVTHPAEVRKAAAWVGDKAKEAGHAITTEAHSLPGQAMGLLHSLAKIPHAAHAAIDGLATLPQQFDWVKSIAGGVDSLAKFTAGFEGHVKGGYGVYRDIAGNLTAGFGHLVRKGEDFSNLDRQGALALLAKDLHSAMSSVAKLVKVHLTGNQADALADFVFNLGEGKLARSTLLKKLNSGDFAGAADQFQYFNKVLQNGHLVANGGLSSRRAAEAALFRAADRPVTITQKTDIHVTGGDAGSTAREVARQQGRVNADLARNLQGAVQ